MSPDAPVADTSTRVVVLAEGQLRARIASELAGLGAALHFAVGPGELEAVVASCGVDLIVVGDAGSDAVAAVRAALVRHAPDASVIVVTHWSEDSPRTLMGVGAEDVIFDDRMERLAPAAQRELTRLRDQRRLRSAEAALRRSEAGMRRVFEAVPDAIGVHCDGVFLWVNAKQAALFGYRSPEEMVGTTVFQHLRGSDPAVARERLARIRAGEQVGLREFRMVRADGREIDIEVASLPFDYEGRPAVLSVARDVTERKDVQARQLQSDRMAAVGRLAAGVAHEINNPLAYVMANLQHVREELAVLQGEPARLAELNEVVAEAAEGAERIRVIVRDLKTFARHEDAPAAPVDLRKVLETAINVASNEIRHRARLVVELQPDLLVKANESALALVFLNLLVNAAQAIPDGARDGQIAVRSFADGQGNAVVTVQDTGVGIAHEHLHRIFEPFFTTRAVGTGKGLGLSVSHGIAAQLGGSIDVDSAAGQGTTFRVKLPLVVRQPCPLDPKTPAAARARVLVVDDEPAVGSSLSRMLSDHEVVVVQSGRAAVDLLVGGDGFDVVLCDLMMPDVSGMDVYDEVAREAADLAERIVFMTGGAFTERAQRFLAAVPNQRLEKPFRREDVQRLVAQHAC